jgi:Pilin (bacterial filament)
MIAPSTAHAAPKPRRTVMQVLKRVLKWVFYLLVCLIGLAMLVVGGVFPVEIAWYLAFGWIHFIVKNLTTVELNPVLVGEGIACTIALGVGAHYFCRWLWREAGASAERAWRWQWTASGLALVLLLFVTGIGTIGVAHQAAWLFSAKEPLLQNSDLPRARISEVLLYGSGVRTVVQEYYESSGRLPQNGDEAGYKFDTAHSIKWVSAVEIRKWGVVAVLLNKEREWPDGGAITFTPTEDADTKKLSWKCRSTLPPRLVPATCRD